jgi:hypothetical protein
MKSGAEEKIFLPNEESAGVIHNFGMLMAETQLRQGQTACPVIVCR